MTIIQCRSCGSFKKPIDYRPQKTTCKKCESIQGSARKAQWVARQRGEAVAPVRQPADRPPSDPKTLVTAHRTQTEHLRIKREHQQLVEALNLAEARNEFIRGATAFEARPVVAREKTSGMREATPVVLCSDLHVEEPIDPEKVNGLNEYNLEIAERRLARMAEGIVWLVEMHRSRFVIRDIVFALLGDLMSGYIHPELVETNLLSPTQTSLWLLERITSLIDYLLEHGGFERVIVPCCYGNHGRSTDKTRVSTGAENSYEWLLYQILAKHYSDEPRVEVIAPKAQLNYVDIFGCVHRFTHGDQLKFAGGVGGILIPYRKAVDGWNVGRHAHWTGIGHWHQYIDTPDAGVNGSLCGYGPYSLRIRARFERAQQLFHMVDSKHGVCLSTPIWVE